MKSLPEFEKFEIGTISLFTGLAFLTIVPIAMNALFFYVHPNVYRFFGGFFLVMAAIFYGISSVFYKKQMIFLGINFIIFSAFQFFLPYQPADISQLSRFLALVIGLILFFLGLFLEKYRSDNNK